MLGKWKSALAKLLVAAMLVQPGVWGASGTAGAAEPEIGGSVAEGVYGDGEELDEPNLSTPAALNATSGAAIGSIQDYKWTQLEVNLPPAARQKAALVHDQNAGNVLLFGGEGTLQLLDDTWIWDGEQQSWSEVLDLDDQPSKRKSAAAAYDPNSGQVLLFGGEGSGGVLGDTWLWDGLQQMWTSTGALPGPSARAGAQIAYDGEQLVLFGGYTLSGGKRVPLGDTWLWNGTAWTQASPERSPPPMYFGGMSYDGNTAILIGGNLGEQTVTHYGDTPDVMQDMTYEIPSALLWRWDREQLTWTSEDGPETFGRWGNAIAYDGRRVVTLHGETRHFNYYGPRIPPFLIYELKLPTNFTNLDYNVGKPRLAYGWTGSGWEPSWNGLGSTDDGFLDVSKYPNDYEPWPHSWPSSRSHASMAFDGYRFILFGGDLKEIKIRASFDQQDPVDVLPAGPSNQTWLFNYTPPGPPSVRMEGEPIIAYDPARVNDSVSVVTNVYGDGNRTVTERGVEYRLAVEPGEPENVWTKQPYTGSATGNIGSFTVTMTNLVWQREYEVKGYATNELGTSNTGIARFKLEDHPNVEEPDVRYDRVGPSVLHVKDKKRIVAVGTGIFDLLRKPLNLIDYYLDDGKGTHYPLDYNVKDARQLELTPRGALPPGTYDVRLKHGFFEDYEFEDALLVTELDFYKPRLFSSVTVSGTNNETGALTLKGMFTEHPSAPNVYVNDPSEPVLINDAVLFKGPRLEVDNSGSTGVIRGEGRLYANASGPSGMLPHTLLDGEWTIASDRFGFDMDEPAADYLNVGLPIKLSEAAFTADGLRFGGEMEVGFTAGSEKIGKVVPIDPLSFRNNRFELIKSYELPIEFKLGPFDVKKLIATVDSRYNHFGLTADAELPDTDTDKDTDTSFKLSLRTVDGRLDSFSFGSDKPSAVGNSGIRVGYVFGQADGLANVTTLPQQVETNGSMTDTLVPELKSGGQRYPMISSNAQPIRMTPYGLTSEGNQKLYHLPINNAWTIAVAVPKTAQTQGFSIAGFRTQGDLNAYGIIEGPVRFAGNARDGLAGQMKATIHVPPGIPQVGGATIRNVTVTVEADKMYGSFKHNDVGVTLIYTFRDNTFLFELKLPPPKPPAWLTALSTAMDYADMFGLFDKTGDTVRVLAAPPAALNVTRTGKTMQPAAQNVRDGIAARIVEGKLASYRQDVPLHAEVGGAGDGAVYRFAVKLPHEAWIALSGDRQDATIRYAANGANGSSGGAVEGVWYYRTESDTTYIRVRLDRPGTWELTTTGSSSVDLHELLYANGALAMDELAALWEAAAERPLTAVTIEETGAYGLRLGDGAGETLLYKPDGRPYRLETSASEPDWNAIRGSDGATYALLEAARPGTWLVDGGQQRATSLYRVPVGTRMSDAREWTESGSYPTAFAVGRSETNQAIAEIYGAGEHARLYAPNGDEYPLRTDRSVDGWNAAYDSNTDKLTVLLEGNALAGQWTVTGDRFADAVVYKASRALESPEALLADGPRQVELELPEAGDYVLALAGAGTDTVVTAPGGQPYPLVFDESSADRNAVLQPELDRRAGTGGSGDVQVGSSSGVIRDERDTLYITLKGAAAGSWTIRTNEPVSWEIYDLPSVPAFTRASAAAASGSDRVVQLEWAFSGAAPNAEVTAMITDGEDWAIGEIVATGLPAAGRTTIALPADLVPGQYRIALRASVEGWAPVHAIADGTATVPSHAELSAPGQPTVTSVGNGEIALSYRSSEGPVSAYRVWVSTEGGLQPALDVAAAAGATQRAVVAGLPTGRTYTLAVSALSEAGERLSAGPLSPAVQAALPAPQPAALDVTLDAGTRRTYAGYDGRTETLLVTAAERPSLRVAADQNAAVTVTVDGRTSSARTASGGSAAVFPLHDLLEVSALSERVYEVTIEARNTAGDRTVQRVKVLVDRTAPLLFASNGGEQLPLNGVVMNSGHLYVTGRTEPGAKLTIDGKAVPLADDGTFGYNATIEWGASEDRKTVEIVAEDEAGNQTTYGFEVLRGQSGPLPTVTMSLMSLAVNGAKLMDPSDSTQTVYRPDRTMYDATTTADRVRVFAASADGQASVSIDGQPVGPNGFLDIDIPPSGKTVVVQPQAAGGQAYTIHFAGYRSSVAALQSLELRDASAGSTGEALPAPDFTGADIDPVYVDPDVSRVTLTPLSAGTGATITVHGLPVTSGEASQPIELQPGVNEVSIVVTAADGTTSKTYTIKVHRTASGVARLEQLQVNGGPGAELQPAFSPSVRDYRVTVPGGASSLSVLAAAEHPDATVRINGHLVTGGSAHPVALHSPSTTIEVEVEAGDETKLVYRIRADRQPVDPGTPPRLSKLVVEGSKLTTDFSPYVRVYGAGTTTRSVATLTVEADDPNAIVSVVGAKRGQDGKFARELSHGNNLLVVQVESADGRASEAYSVAIERQRTGSTTSERTVKAEGDDGKWTIPVPIVRTSGQGRIVDTLKLDDRTARSIVAQAEQAGQRTVYLRVDDLPNAPADERVVRLAADSAKTLASGQLTLVIALPEGRIVVGQSTLSQMGGAGKELYWRIVPVREAGERGEIDKRAGQAEQGLSVVGEPVRIETNYAGYATRLVFPLTGLALPRDTAGAERMASRLAVYIEHSDGEKTVRRGELDYDESGAAGLVIEIDKFSTFALVRASEGDRLAPYLSGYPDGTFRPEHPVTRAELAAMLYRLIAEEDKDAQASDDRMADRFRDVPERHWASAQIAAMRRLGLMQGDPQGRFRPDDPVTRAEIAQIAVRWATAEPPEADMSTAAAFIDAEGHWAASAISRAQAAGWMNGYLDGTFRPNGNITRAEAVKTINRLTARPVDTGIGSSGWPDVPDTHWALADIESASRSVPAPPQGGDASTP